MAQAILFEDVFEVRQLNPDGKKFDRVNRLHCKGITFDVDLVVGILHDSLHIFTYELVFNLYRYKL